MWFYLKLAWRNIFRNKRRTIIASIAIGIGLASLIFFDALLIGMKDNLIKSATSTFLGEAQIHRNEFRETQEANLTIVKSEGIIKSLGKEEIVEAFTPRTLSFGMLSSPANVNAVVLAGIEPETEKALSKIDDTIIAGDFFKSNNKREIIIGNKLAETLEVSLGDRVVVTVSQIGSGDLSQEMFRISGIYRFNIKEMDSGMAFIRLPKAQEMLGLEGQIHEIAIKFKKLEYASQAELPFWKKYAKNDNEAAGWLEIMPQMKAVFDMTSISRFVMIFILFVVVLFGIINTLFMSLYERMFEFGVLRAIGTRPSGARKLMLFEAGALGILSITIGVILGLAICLISAQIGFNWQGLELAGASIQEVLYPVIQLKQYIFYPLSIFIFTLIIGLYPAYIAGKMNVADALRKSL